MLRAQVHGAATDSVYSCTVLIHANLPKYDFRLYLVSQANELGERYTVSRIEIKLAGESRIVQTLRGRSTTRSFSPGMFKTIDLNFDGYLDLILEYDWPSGGTLACVWLFDPKSGRFKYNEELSEMFDLVPDTSQKTITTTWEKGACCGTVETYRFERGKLVRISEVTDEVDDKTMQNIQRIIRTTKVFRGKKAVSTKIDTLTDSESVGQ